MLRGLETVIPLTLLFTLSFGTFSHSQTQQEVIPIDLPTALEMAKANYPSLKKRLAEREAAGEEIEATIASYYPRVGVQAQTLLATSNQVRGGNLGYEGMLVGLSGSVKTTGFDWQPAWTSLATTMVDWPAFTFGRRAADKNLAASRQELADQLYEQELFEHQIKVADAYLLALNALKVSELQERNLRRTEDIVAVTRANASSGLKAGIDSSIAIAESTRALLQWMNSQAQAKKYHVLLSELIGDTQKIIDADTMNFFSKIPSNFTFQSSEPDKHPRVLSMRARQLIGQEELKKTRLGAMPEVRIMGSFWGRGSGIGQKPAPDGSFDISSSLSGLNLRAFNYAAGATLLWYPTRGFQVRRQVSALQYRNSALTEEYNNTLLRTTAELKNADIQFNLAYQAVQNTPLLLEAAKQAYTQSMARYESGLENIMLLTQVRDIYIKAETEYLVSVNNVWRSLLIKAAAKGDFSVFLEQIPN
jgi:outer membrane protein TolC